MRVFYSITLRERLHFTLFRRLSIMRSKRVSADEQFRLIMECRQSGLSDYQWCQLHDINPGTFYNWISRLRKRGIEIPAPAIPHENQSLCSQDVVKVDLIPEPVPFPEQMEQTTSILPTIAKDTHPTVEIMIGNAVIRFCNDADPKMIETTLRCLGGAAHAG